MLARVPCGVHYRVAVEEGEVPDMQDEAEVIEVTRSLINWV